MNSFEQISISSILKWSRLNNELTLANVSKKSGLSLQYIAELERGEKQPTPSAVNILCEIYNIEINLDEKEKKEAEERLKCFINMLSSFRFKEINVNESILYEQSFSYGFLYDLLILKVKLAFFDQNFIDYNEFTKIFGDKYENLDGMIQKIYLFLQSLYYSYKNESIALDYAERSIEGSENAKALLKTNYASLLEKEGSLIEAIKQYSESIIDAQQYGFFDLMLLSKMNEALVLLELRQFRDGIKMLEMCIKTAEMNHNDEIIEKCKVNIAYALLLQNSLEEAEEYCLHNFKLNHPIRIFTEKINNIYFKEEFPTCTNSSENKKYQNLYMLMKDTFYNLNKNVIEKNIKELKNDYTFYTLYLNYCMFLLKNRNEDKEALIILAELTNYKFLSRKID